MNYLAHAFLSPETPLLLMGNLWGDLIKPRDYALIPEMMVEGIQMHKKIDAFTDQHPAVDEMIQLLRPFQGKYTPVVADVLMDFILSKNWERSHVAGIEEFCETTYQVVRTHLSLLPERIHPRIHRMLGDRWLESCKNRNRMERTLRMLSMRASFENQIPEAMIPYDLHEERMDQLFADFFEDLMNHVNLQSAS